MATQGEDYSMIVVSMGPRTWRVAVRVGYGVCGEGTNPMCWEAPAYRLLEGSYHTESEANGAIRELLKKGTP